MAIRIKNAAGIELIRPNQFEKNLSRRFRQQILKNGNRRYVSPNGRHIAVVINIP